MNKYLIYIVLLFLVPSDSLASIYRNYYVEDGLSHNSVWAVMQDRQGYIWFGTNDGLDRFDGVNFRVFRYHPDNPSSIGHNFIHCLKETLRGKFLVGTKGGLYLYNRDNETFSHVVLNTEIREKDQTSIHCIIEDRQGDVWIGCYGDGVYCLSGMDMKVKKHYAAKNLPSVFVNSLCCDLSDNIWIGTERNGLYQLNSHTGKVSQVRTPANSISSLFCDKNNNLWIGSDAQGLYKYSIRGNSYECIEPKDSHIKMNNIKSIISYNAQEIMMSTESGAIRVNIETNEIKTLGEGKTYDNNTDRSIFSICKDNEGGLWFGKYFTGVTYWSPYANRFSYYPCSISANLQPSIVLGFAEDANGDVWIATRDNGILCIDSQSRTLRTEKNAFANHHVQAVASYDGKLWLSIYNKGVVQFDPVSQRIIASYNIDSGLASNICTSIHRCDNGTICFGTDNGVNLLRDGVITTVESTLKHPVKAVIEDYEGHLWLACHKYGVVRLGKDGSYKCFTHRHGDKSSIMSNNVNTIFQDTKGILWVGTEGFGLGMFNIKTGKILHIFSEQEGMPSNTIYSIQEDHDGHIWVTTGGGLVRIASGSRVISTFKYIEEQLHFNYSHNSSLLSRQGMLYYGGSTGMLTFSPHTVATKRNNGKVILTGLYIDGREQLPDAENSPLTQSISLTKSLVLSASQNRFSLTAACLSFLSPDQNDIYYMLEGFDHQWNRVSARQARISYMNIPAGHYTLSVKGSSDNGHSFSQPVTLEITILRPFLLSNMMIAIYIAILIALFFYAKSRYRKHLVAANERKMFHFTMEKEKELYDQKINFFTNIAHEIRTPLSLISAPLESIITSGDGTQKTQGNLLIIRNNVKRLLELINQLLDFRKVEEKQMQLYLREGDIAASLKNICGRYEQYCRLNNLTLTLNLSSMGEPESTLVFDPDALEKIVGNLLSNAIKFTTKHINVVLEYDDDNVIIHVSDDGPGIKEEEQKSIFDSFYQIDDNGHHRGTGLGLPLARSLAIMHGGSLIVESKYGHGSTFVLQLPRNISVNVTEDVHESNINQHPTPIITQLVDGSSGEVLLIIEDNDELRNFIANELCTDYSILQAANGIEALKCLEEYQVNVIVSDIMMPEMDGIEFLKAVRSNTAYSHLPFIMLSAKTDVKTKVEGLNLGADAYIEKPFAIEQLKAQLYSIRERCERMRKLFAENPLEYYRHAPKEDVHDKEAAEFISNLNAYILDHYTEKDFSIDNLARHFYMSRSNFHKKVKAITGNTPNDYIRIIRLNRSLELLSSGKYQIMEVCYMVGFNTPSYFSKCFSEHFGKLPNEYLKG